MSLPRRRMRLLHAQAKVQLAGPPCPASPHPPHPPHTARPPARLTCPTPTPTHPTCPLALPPVAQALRARACWSTCGAARPPWRTWASSSLAPAWLTHPGGCPGPASPLAPLPPLLSLCCGPYLRPCRLTGKETLRQSSGCSAASATAIREGDSCVLPPAGLLLSDRGLRHMLWPAHPAFPSPVTHQLPPPALLPLRHARWAILVVSLFVTTGMGLWSAAGDAGRDSESY